MLTVSLPLPMHVQKSGHVRTEKTVSASQEESPHQKLNLTTPSLIPDFQSPEV